MEHSIVHRVDARNGSANQCGPDGTKSKTYFAAMAFESGGDACDEFFRGGIHARNAAVALIEGPDGACAGGRNSRIRADRNLRGGWIRRRINFRENAAIERSNPY